MTNHINLLVDGLAARVGGGVRRLDELRTGIPTVASRLEVQILATTPDPREDLLPTVWRQRPFSYPLTRCAYEHFLLPWESRRVSPDWILSPFNVLPIGPGIPRWTSRSLIVSNIAPFAPEMIGRGSSYQRWRNRALRSWTAASISRADLVFTLSGEAEGRLARILRGRRVVRLPMAPPAPDILQAAARTPVPTSVGESPYFVAVGDLLPHKGVEDAIRAIRVLRSNKREARLVVCGRPMDTRYVARLRGLAGDQEGRSILFLGGIHHLQVLSLIRHSVATVVCSRIENPNRVPVEAMAVGSPIAAADVPIAREVCGDAAAYYNAGRPEELAGIMLELMEDRGLAESLRARGTKRIAPVDWLSATRKMLESMELL